MLIGGSDKTTFATSWVFLDSIKGGVNSLVTDSSGVIGNYNIVEWINETYFLSEIDYIDLSGKTNEALMLM